MSNVKVDYHNATVQQLLDKYVTTEKYGKYKYFLDEIIHRRAFEFRFPIKRIEDEIKSMVENIEDICFDSEDSEITLTKNTTAGYSPKTKKIYINEKLFDEYYKHFKSIYPDEVANYMIGEKLFSALNHEVYHAITRTTDRTVGIEHIDYEEAPFVRCTHINEVLTESASTRTVKNKNASNFKSGYRETLGYQNTTCMTGLLAHALGVSEKDLLSHSLGDFEEFRTFFALHAPSGQGDMSIDTDIMSLDSAAKIANAHIMDKKPEKNAPVFLRMYKTVLELAGRHVGADQRVPTIETIGEMFCRALKMNTIIISSLNYLEREGVITPEGKREILEDEKLSKLVDSNRKRILGKFLIYKEKLQPGTIEYNYAKWGTPLEVFKNFSDEDISSEAIKKYKNSSYDEIEQALRAEAQIHPKFFRYSLDIINDDFQSILPWDNSIFYYGARILRDQKAKTVIEQKTDKLFSVNDSTIPAVAANASLVGQKIDKKNKSLDDEDDAR